MCVAGRGRDGQINAQAAAGPEPGVPNAAQQKPDAASENPAAGTQSPAVATPDAQAAAPSGGGATIGEGSGKGTGATKERGPGARKPRERIDPDDPASYSNTTLGGL